MKNYQVTITYQQSIFADLTLTIAAESKAAACSRAKEMDDDDLIDYTEAKERSCYPTCIVNIKAKRNKEPR